MQQSCTTQPGSSHIKLLSTTQLHNQPTFESCYTCTKQLHKHSKHLSQSDLSDNYTRPHGSYTASRLQKHLLYQLSELLVGFDLEILLIFWQQAGHILCNEAEGARVCNLDEFLRGLGCFGLNGVTVCSLQIILGVCYV